MKRKLQTLFRQFALTLSLFCGIAASCQAQIGREFLPMPDLIIGTTSIYQDTATGQWKAAIQVKNIGDAASGACTLQMLRHTGIINQLPSGLTMEAVFIQRVSVPGIARGGSTTVYFSYTTYPTGQWGDMMVDCYNNVVELHPLRPLAELNNKKNIYF